MALLWAWSGIVEFMVFFGGVSTQYYFWGGLWIVQALLWLMLGFKGKGSKFTFDKSYRGYIGLFFIVYALLFYPLFGYLAGHGYPAGPIFGVAPCPVCIFTFGILLMLNIKIPYYVMGIPFVWGLLGIPAVFILGVYADAGEVVAAVVGIVLMHSRNKRLQEIVD
jgi:hypothetical protein